MVLAKTMNDTEADLINAAYKGGMDDNHLVVSSDTNKLFIKFDGKLYKVKSTI